VERVLFWFHGLDSQKFDFVPVLHITFFELLLGRDVGWLEFPRKQVIEINVLEKPMSLNIFGSSLEISKSFRQVSSKQVLDQRLKVGVEPVWVLWLRIYNLPVNVHGVIVLKWRVACEHFVYQDAQGPPVYWLAMTLI
jgi:hypothetical protein